MILSIKHRINQRKFWQIGFFNSKCFHSMYQQNNFFSHTNMTVVQYYADGSCSIFKLPLHNTQYWSRQQVRTWIQCWIYAVCLLGPLWDTGCKKDIRRWSCQWNIWSTKLNCGRLISLIQSVFIPYEQNNFINMTVIQLCRWILLMCSIFKLPQHKTPAGTQRWSRHHANMNVDT